MPHPSRSTGRRVAALALLALPLAACVSDRSVTGSVYPRDYRERHPVVLGDAPRSLDIFIAGEGLDGRQRDDVRAFAQEYRRTGRGPMSAQLPAGAPAASAALAAIRHALAEGGLPGAPLSVSTYQPSDPALAAPIRLSFPALKAGVAGQCGLWPQDLGLTDIGFNMRNQPYWNHGCATQSNVAAQVADPVDLVRGRAEGRADAIRRGRNIENIRQGKDPSTDYRQDGRNQINRQLSN
jgi:pilus assembly protein CpaD